MKILTKIGVTTILDPEGPFLQMFYRIVVISCEIAVCLDPLLIYTLSVDAAQLCFSVDRTLAFTFCALRSFIDAIYVFYIFLRFRTGFITPHSRLLVKYPKAIAKRYFMLHIVSILPLPQLAMVIPAVTARFQVEIIKLSMSQNLSRIARMGQLDNQVTGISGLIRATAWGEAAMNFCYYMLASHVIGAFWYLSSLERAESCWRAACNVSSGCNVGDLFCGGDHHGSNSFLHSSCSPSESVYDYGIYRNALRFQIGRSFVRFRKRIFYSFVWGLRNLSSLGQNLQTSDHDMWESSFVVVISFTGLILFSVLAGNIQKYCQCLTYRADEKRVKLHEREQWMSSTKLPQSLRSRVILHEEYVWEKSRGVDEESLIRDLPMDLRRDIKRHQCCRLLRRVPTFDMMDEQLLDSLCCCLKRVFYTAHTIVGRKGFPVDQMIFIASGSIMITTTSNPDSLNKKVVKFCGEELLTWAMDPNSSSCLPISTRTLQTVDDVEGFSLARDDLKGVVSQFRHLQGELFEKMLRFYSKQWRSWGASKIQAAWRRYRRRKMEKSLKARMQKAASSPGPSFATKTRAYLRPTVSLPSPHKHAVVDVIVSSWAAYTVNMI